MKVRYVKEADAVNSYAVYSHGHRPASYGVFVDGVRRGALVGVPGSYRRGSYRVEVEGRRPSSADTLRSAKRWVEFVLAHPDHPG